MPHSLEIVGVPPEINGHLCEGFICEEYVFEGKIEATANVTYLKFDGIWYRLYFEPQMVFWRESSEAPAPWSVKEKSWEYPHVDLGETEGLLGKRLKFYEMAATSGGSKVVFQFEGGKQIVIEDKNEVANYAVI